MISRRDLIKNIENFQPNWTILDQFRWVVIDNDKNAICMSPACFSTKGECNRDYKRFKGVSKIDFEAYKGLDVEYRKEFRWYIISIDRRLISTSNRHFNNIYSCKNDALEHGLNFKNRVEIYPPSSIQLLNDW